MSKLEWRDISAFNIDNRIRRVLEKRGMTKLNPVQVEAVEKGLLEGKRLLLASPTGSGKTLIAELGIISHLLNHGGKAVYVTPLRALTSEKYRTFLDWQELGFKVAMSSGDYDSDDSWLENYDIIITTYEKLDSLWRHRPEWLKEVEYFALDEFHYINDGDRGPVVESVAIRAKRRNLIALSATISNYEQISKWLNAEYVYIPWRPVPLVEGVMFQEGRKNTYTVIFNDGTTKKVKGEDPILAYTIESLLNGGQVLVFRNSRRLAESTAKKLAQSMGLVDLDDKYLLKVSEEIRNLEDAGSEEKEDLANLVIRGVAYHHAGLSRSMRDIIEREFLNRKIKVIVATPTLAAGVNLPARTVIIGDINRFNRHIIGYWEGISVMEYKQMSGRAGRPGFDEKGEAVIVVRDRYQVEEVFKKYIQSPPEPLESRLGSERAFYTFLLGILSSEGDMNEKELYNYVSESLLPRNLLDSYFDRAIVWLKDNGFIDDIDGKYHLTDFGKRVSDLYINPFTARQVKDALSSVKDEEVCDLAYLHMLAYTPDAPTIGVSKKDEEELPTMANCELLIEEPYDEDELALYLSALKIALIIKDWIEEVDEDIILQRYGIGSGDLRSIVETMDWLTYSGYQIAKVLNMAKHEQRLKILNLRVKDGVKEDLLELVQIPGIGRKRARMLAKANIRHLEDVITKADKVKIILGPKLGEKVVQEAAKILSHQ
ncbi:MAG: DEAD/DEAH box helicase [Sulfolobaceae archaeon]|nr:DEAD/DEAH box helicase [Sulfolobaceae archaeon]